MFQPNKNTEGFGITKFNGRRWWTANGVRIALVVSGGSDDDDDEDHEDEEDEESEEDDEEEAEDKDDKDDDKKSKSKKSKAKVVPQDEVNRIMAREKRQGHEAGKRALMKELGLNEDELEEFKAKLAKDREAEDAKLSEADKAKREAARATREAETARREAANERFAARLERALTRAGCEEEEVEDAALLLKLKPDDDPDQEDIKAAVKKLKRRHPEMFGEGKKESGGSPNSDPGRGPGSKSKLGSKESAAVLLAQRHPPKEKTSA